MRNRRIISAVCSALFLLPAAAWSQTSSINTFSPYSLYGIGNLGELGTANIRSMGGAGTAYRDSYLNPYSSTLNTLNPAAYSAIPRKSFIFNFELEGQNFYLKDAKTKSSYNTFNVRDVAVLFPLANKIGFSVSVTPYSSVGYRIKKTYEDDKIIGEIGEVNFQYEGEGDITQLKAGLGIEVFKNFSVGAEMVYYFGDINRTQVLEIIPFTGSGKYSPATCQMKEDISKILANIGIQYNPIVKLKRILTIGATYRMGGKLKPKKKVIIPSYDFDQKDIWHKNATDDKFKMADVLSLGLYYQTSKLGAAMDYSFANWGSRNKMTLGDGKNYTKMGYTNTNTFKTGIQYTPDRFDIRRFLNRLTYRAGFRYTENYMTFDGKKIKDKAVTLGVGIPVKMTSLSNINIGLEYGQRGSTRGKLIKESYFKFSIGLSLFGEDYWFRKQKYD